MNLEEYIEKKFKGNKSEFGRTLGILNHHVIRMIGKGCIWYKGQVYRPLTKHKESNNEKSS